MDREEEEVIEEIGQLGIMFEKVGRESKEIE